MPALGDEINAEQQIAELARTAERLARQLAKEKKKTADLVGAVYEAAKDAAVVTGRPKPVPRPKMKAGKGDAEWAVCHITDLQLGKVAGKPGSADYYDPDVCEQRVRYVVDRVRRITEIQRKDHPVPGIAVLFGGDMVEGTNIFPGQVWEVGGHTGYQQLMRASALMAEVVLSFLEDFEEVKVYSVHGNHGRIGRRGDYPREDNLDNIAYALARQHLSGQDRVTWSENLNWYEHIQIGAWSACLIHGDQVKSWGGGGTPASALSRRATAWSSSMPFKWTDLFVGHYHQRLALTLPDGSQVRMTPSTESGSQYAAELMASRGKPGSLALMVHPQHGRVTGEWMIWLD